MSGSWRNSSTLVSKVKLCSELYNPGRAHRVQCAVAEDASALPWNVRLEVRDGAGRGAEARRQVDARPLCVVENVVRLEPDLREAMRIAAQLKLLHDGGVPVAVTEADKSAYA